MLKAEGICLLQKLSAQQRIAQITSAPSAVIFPFTG